MNRQLVLKEVQLRLLLVRQSLMQGQMQNTSRAWMM